MRARLANEDGFTLIELLMSSALLLVVIGATLTAFDRFQYNARVNERRNDASDQVRRTVDLLTRDLRNLADPTNQALSIESKSATDLVFRSVDPAATGTDANRVGVRRVRYCLNATTGIVYRETQQWTTVAIPTVPSTAACGPADVWSGACVLDSTCSRIVAAEFVTNSRTATPRALFGYDATANDAVTAIRVNAYVDVNGASQAPAETNLESSVNLRNQNRRPTAVLAPPVRAGGNDFLLNASGSSDPEGALLKYEFLKTTAGVETSLGPAQNSPTLTKPLADGDSVRVKVTDPGNLSAYSESRTVSVQ